MSPETGLMAALRPRLDEAVDYAQVTGLLKYTAQGALAHAPFALIPSPLPRQAVQSMAALSVPFNRLARAIADTPEFLREALEPAARSDAFTAQLLNSMRPRHPVQPLTLLVVRSDYFMHHPAAPAGGEVPVPVVRQVELNTISAGYAGLSPLVHRLHAFLLREHPEARALIPNDSLTPIADAMSQAVSLYGHPAGCVLMVVQPRESNIVDQRLLEFALRERGVKTRRATLAQVAQEGELREGHLWMGDEVAAVTYFRAGYGPEDLDSPETVRARERIEASATISVPSLAEQLTGAKKIQQLLTHPETLRQFAPHNEARLLQAAFAGQWDPEQILEGPWGGKPAWQVALANPSQFVAKPQREGGGHNKFDEDLTELLRGSTPQSRAAYILMERLRPIPHETLLVREGRVTRALTVSEVGRYGVLLSQGKKELRNTDSGYLVRTKPAEVAEGGVTAGFGYLDSLMAVPNP